eukprot:scaffold5504_cov101-Isochrysis_galbana.AAC.12
MRATICAATADVVESGARPSPRAGPRRYPATGRATRGRCQAAPASPGACSARGKCPSAAACRRGTSGIAGVLRHPTPFRQPSRRPRPAWASRPARRSGARSASTDASTVPPAGLPHTAAAG